MATGSIEGFAASAHAVGGSDLDIKQIERREKLITASNKRILALEEAGKEKAAEKEQKRQEKLSKALTDYEKREKEAALKEEEKERKRIEKEISQSRLKSANEFIKKYTGNLTGLIGSLGGTVEKYVGIYDTYMASINTRLQGAGAGFNFQSINDVLRRNTAFNPFIKYQDVLSNLNTLVAAGIADNVVQRAFLNTIKDEIATTFDAAQGSLLEIVRIQQRDSTAARLGMEAELTKLFNYYFSDTSYLGDTFDAVQQTMIDLSSQLDEKSAVELEYIVQKWLGSLGSVGVSSNVLQTLAQGITYLGTGNVNQLSSNQALQNLLVMASSRAGLDYSSMLTGGISASQANTLLASVISYVQEIAGSSNNVVKQQYAQLFGLTVADMRAFQNINDEVLNSLIQNGMTYSDTLQELNNQIGQIGDRMHLSTMINNVIENAMSSVGLSVLNNTAAYGIWRAADLLESITGGIELPFISALGSGTDLNMSLEGLVKGGVIGFGAINTLISGIGALSNVLGGDGILGTFNSQGVSSLWNVGLNKGTGFSGYQNAGRLSTTASSTAYVSSGSELGIQQSLSDTQRQAGQQVSGEEQSLSASDTARILQALDENLQALWNYFKNGNAGNPLTVRFSENYPFTVTGTSGLY